MEIINKDKRQAAIIRSVVLFSTGFLIMGITSYQALKVERKFYEDKNAQRRKGDTCLTTRDTSLARLKKLGNDTLLWSNRMKDTTKELARMRDTFKVVCDSVDKLNILLSTRSTRRVPELKSKVSPPVSKPKLLFNKQYFLPKNHQEVLLTINHMKVINLIID